MLAVRCWLNSIVTRNGYILNGVEFLPDTPKAVVVHVHGSLGNFYHQPFLREFGHHWQKRGIALLSYNLRTHDGIAEGYHVNGDMEYVGGSVSVFETCIEDIDALVLRARSISKKVYLQGHSMGCDRVTFYTMESGSRYPLILLSPCNSKNLQSHWLDEEGVQDQLVRLTKGPERERDEFALLPSYEYGIRAPEGWTYAIPISEAAFRSIAEGPVFRLFDVSREPTEVGKQPAWIYLGAADPIRGCSLEAMEEHLTSMFPDVTCAKFGEGGHDLEGYAQPVAEALGDWIVTLADGRTQNREGENG